MAGSFTLADSARVRFAADSITYFVRKLPQKVDQS